MKMKARHGITGDALGVRPDLTKSLRPVGIRVVAVIPCLNTEPFIGDIVLQARKYVDEVIVVDDGSRDKTADVARAAGATVISHDKNSGYGEAIKSCFNAAKNSGADVLVIIDGDGQHNPDEIPRLLAPVFQDGADLVIGSRFPENGEHMPRYRKFGINFITYLWNFASMVKVSDSQSGFRAYTKNVMDALDLTERGMSISIEILEQLRVKGSVINEVQISCRYFKAPFNLKVFWHGFSVALAVIRIRIKNKLSETAKTRTAL